MSFVLRKEGGFADHKHDLGGRTNFGVTQRTYNHYNKSQGLPKKDVKGITKKEVVDIYYKLYWVQSRANKMADENFALAHFDSYVLSPRMASICKKQSNGDVEKYLDRRIQYHRDRVAKNPTQKTFLKGWLNRVEDLRQEIQKNKTIAC